MKAMATTATRTPTDRGLSRLFYLESGTAGRSCARFSTGNTSKFAMVKGASKEVRVPAKETVDLGGLQVTNRTANSILVKKTAKGLVVADCCLEEQGM